MRIRFSTRHLVFYGITTCCIVAALSACAFRAHHPAAIIESLGGACIPRYDYYPAGVWPNDIVEVYLWDLDIEDYSFLAECPRLEVLLLDRCESFSDDDVRHLAGMSSLQELILNGTSLTSRGIDAIPGDKLCSLALNDTGLDDDCLLRLLRFPSLTGVHCRDTDVTRAGAKRFVEARDGAEVMLSSGPVR